jgi:hypothetical protein
LTLDGTDPSQANVDNLIEFFQTYLTHDTGNVASVADTLIFETKVSGGETLKLAYAGAQDTWEDASGTKKLLIQQLSY